MHAIVAYSYNKHAIPRPSCSPVTVTGPYTDLFGFLYVSEPGGDCLVTSCSESQAQPRSESLVDWYIMVMYKL